MMIQQKALRTSKWAWAVSLCLCAGFILSSGIAHAQQGGVQKLVYEVYAGGIHAVQVDLMIDTSKSGQYEINMGAKTRGFLGRLAPWHGTFASNGWHMGDDDTADFRPRLHKSIATWQDETEIKEYKYTKDRKFNGLFIKDHDKPVHKKTVADALTQGTTDALSATLAMFKTVGTGKDCAGDAEVFDGKRRFKMIFNQEARGMMKSSRYNIYEGAAVECTVEVQPVAGEWHKKPRGWLSIQEQGREKGTMPTMWLAKITDDLPAVPVKVRVKTDYGTLFMHLKEYHSDGKVMMADGRD